jgi:multiple sugar transport system substrate-binding protein
MSVIMILVTIIAVTGCASPTTPTEEPAQPAEAEQPAEPAEPEPAAEEAKTVTVWMPHQPMAEKPSPREEAERNIYEEFIKANPNIAMDFQQTSWMDLDGKVMAAHLAGNDPDLYNLNLYWYTRHVDAGITMPLDDLIANSSLAEDFDDIIRPDLLVTDGKQMALWKWVIPTALLYRKDLFEEAGMDPPMTWDELVEAGQKLTVDTDGDGNMDQWGFCFTGSKAEAGYHYVYIPFAWGEGGEIFDEEFNAVFNDKAGVDSLQFTVDLVQKYEITPPDVTAWAYDDVTRGMENGTCAMIVEGSHRVERVVQGLGDPEMVGVSYIPSSSGNPTSPTMFTAWTFSIPTGSQHPEEAFKYIEHFQSPESQWEAVKTAGQLPNRYSLLEDPFFDDPSHSYIKFWMEYVKENAKVTPNPPQPGFFRMCDIMETAFHEVLLGEKDAQQALDDAVATWNSELER